MRGKRIFNAVIVLLICGVIAVCAGAVQADSFASISVSCGPSTNTVGTANSVYTLHFTYTIDSTPAPPIWSYIEFVDANDEAVVIPIPVITPGQGIPQESATDPYYQVVGGSGSTIDYEMRFTSGIQMYANAGVAPDPTIFFVRAGYGAGLSWNNTGQVNEHYIVADYADGGAGTELLPGARGLTYTPHILALYPKATSVTDVAGTAFTVHDSAPNPNYGPTYWGDIGGYPTEYAGQLMDRDFLWGYNYYGDNTEGGAIAYQDMYPLETTRFDGQSPDITDDSDPVAGTPNDGTTSSNYTFRVLYTNVEGLPPRAWIPEYTMDEDGSRWAEDKFDTGVVLYLWNPRVGLYRAYPMQIAPGQPASPTAAQYEAGVVYQYTFGFQHLTRAMNNGMPVEPDYSHPDNYFPYVSLPVGAYSYFFGTTDDAINLPYPLENDAVDYVPGWLDPEPFAPGDGKDYDSAFYWGYMYPSNDDHMPYPVDNDYNLNLYVDRVTYQPGVANAFRDTGLTSQPLWYQFYPYPADAHPMVTLGLYGPQEDNGEPYNGHVPWDGTVTPYRAGVDPVNNTLVAGAVAKAAGTTPQAFLPTCVVPSSGLVNFQIRYAQLYGVLPESSAGGEINVWVNNSEYGMGAANASPAAYTAYPLQQVIGDDGDITAQSTNQQPGVLYSTATPIALSPGPHTYYFTASDGEKTVYFPTRPTLGGIDFGVAGTSPNEVPNIEYFNGPYVNNPPVLSSPQVLDTRTNSEVGTAGDNFQYSVVYKDADGQRPYQAFVVIQFQNGGTLANGGAIAETMTPVLTAADIKAGLTFPSQADFQSGVTYVFNSSNLAQKLQPGQRAYYFDFMDDWGSPSDLTNKIQGEEVWSSTATGGSYSGPAWMSGPYISVPYRPTLDYGSVSSSNGTDNTATQFTYKVEYTSSSDLPPAYMNVYIGTTQSDGTITWDNGHAMTAVDSSDTIYTAGTWYSYTSTVSGGTPAVNHYYCFVASDGVNVAQFSSTDANSASGAVWSTLDPTGLTAGTPGERLKPINANSGTGEGTVFQTSQKPLVGPISAVNFLSLYTSPLVYNDQNEKLLTINKDYDIDCVHGLITLINNETSTYLDVQYLFGTPGPTAVGADIPPALSSGIVDHSPGFSTDKYVFSVTYTDQNGPSGQAPSFVNAIVDGKATLMTVATLGTPNYKLGAQFQSVMTLTPGVHTFYFEASNGAGYAIYDQSGNRSSNSPIQGFTPILGPYVVDYPTLTSATINPNSTAPATIDVSQSVTYTVTYTEDNNEGPQPGYPVVYIDNLAALPNPAPVNTGTVSTVTATTLTDDTQSWTPSQFKGLPVQMTSGKAQGSVYEILDNSATTLTLAVLDLVNQGGVVAQDTFSIGKLQLYNMTPTNQNYTAGVTYGITVPGLGAGANGAALQYYAHFRASTSQVIGPNNTTRLQPSQAEVTGPNVSLTTPTGTQSPQLTLPTPASGLSEPSTYPWTFTVLYTDPNNFPPALHQNVAGYINLVVDNVNVYPMVGPTSPQYSSGAVYSYPAAGLPGIVLSPGVHKFHFTASNGYLVTSLPAASAAQTDYTLNVFGPPTLSNAQVSPLEHNCGRTFDYTVTYTDTNVSTAYPNGIPPYGLANGTPELYIDGKLVPETVTDSSGNIITRNYMVTNNAQPWSAGTTYTFALQTDIVQPGMYFFPNETLNHTFHFTVSDGMGSTVSTPEIDYPNIQVDTPSTAPILLGGSVSPTSGNDGTAYVFNVNYSDPNDDDPMYVYVDIDGGAQASPAGITLTMTEVNPGESDYNSPSGVPYTATQPGLPVGNHTFAFRTSDWLETASLAPTPNAITVSQRPLSAITLSGLTSQVYVGVPVVLSGSMSPSASASLTLTATGPGTTITDSFVQSASGTFSTDPLTFTAVGTWTVTVTWAGNSTFQGGSAQLVVNVLPRPVASIIVGTSGSPVLGSSTNIQGTVAFNPSDIPTGVQITVQAQSGSKTFTQNNVTVASNGSFSTPWIPSLTGNWTLTAAWAGNKDYAQATGTATVSVGGPSTTINGLELMSLPLVPTSGFPDSVMGATPPYAVARWIPSMNGTGDYMIYSWLPGGTQAYNYPAMAPGQGFWIKTDQAKTIAPSGSLWPVNQNCVINLDPSGGGWNQIGSPFATEVQWSGVMVQMTDSSYNPIGSPTSLFSTAAAAAVRNYAWKYDPVANSYVLLSTYASAGDTTMKPWYGYWIRALEYCQLIIPAQGSTVSAASAGAGTASVKVSAAATSQASIAGNGWVVTLKGSNGSATGTGQFGGGATVAAMFDSPLPLENYVDLFLTSDGSGHYANDIRTSAVSGDKWTFKVASDSAADVQLTWDGLGTVPAQLKLTLVDETANKSVAMTANGSYTFHLSANALTRAFHIVAEN